MTLFHSGFWWIWGPMIVVCGTGLVATRRQSSWYPVFWIPLVALSLVFVSVFLQSCGAGPKDGPSGLVNLFIVFPVIFVSGLGGVGLYLLMLVRPDAETWSSRFTLVGAVVAAVAVWVSIEREKESLSVVVLDGAGQPCGGVPVELVMSDLVTNEHRLSETTDEKGRATFRVWPFRRVELFASKDASVESRAIFGESGYGGRPCWKHMWGTRQRYYFGLGCSFLGDTDSTSTTLYLRSSLGEPTQVLATRLTEDLASAAKHAEGPRFLASPRCPEGLGLLDAIVDVAKDNPNMEDAVSTCLSGLAEIVWRTWDKGRGRTDAEGRRVIVGEPVEVHAERLMDAARPLLGVEFSSGGVYGQLRHLARHRVGDLVEAHSAATPRGKQVIRAALEDIQPPFEKVARLLGEMDLERALRLLARIDHFSSQEDFEQARSWVEQARREQGGKQEHQYWFEYLGHRFDRPQDYEIRIGQ